MLKQFHFLLQKDMINQIGLIIILYKEPKKYDYKYARKILPRIQKLAILLDYDKNK